MFRTLFLLFLIVPIIEIAFLIQLSDVIGGGATIILVIATAYLGAKLVKSQGLQAFHNMRTQSSPSAMPGAELFNGVCILISGVLLLTPGVFTDVIGFLLLTPPVRIWLGAALVKKVMSAVATQSQNGQAGFSFTSAQFGQNPHSHSSTQSQNGQVEDEFQPFNKETKTEKPRQSTIIDGEYERKD